MLTGRVLFTGNEQVLGPSIGLFKFGCFDKNLRLPVDMLGQILYYRTVDCGKLSTLDSVVLYFSPLQL